MTKLLSYGCATWLLTLGFVHAQPSNVATNSAVSATAPVAVKPSDAHPPIWHSQPVATRPIVPEALQLDDPVVLTTAKLQNGNQVVTLNGIEGLDGDAAEGLRTYLSGQHLTCQPSGDDRFDCALPDGTNVAEAALINGAARTTPDAADAYKADEAQAQDARRGLWSDISLLPPVSVAHPTVQDTATLVADQTTVVLDGIQGLGEPYAEQLQSFLDASGDRVVCLPQSMPGRFVCTTNDGTDIAKVALVNGAATVAPTASAAYQAQQAEAIANQRGIWADQPADEAAYVDGITYVDGEPRAWIDGSFVSLAYADGGWGYYDGGHHWHVAPASFAAHMSRFHPGGSGLGHGHGADGGRSASAGHGGHGAAEGGHFGDPRHAAMGGRGEGGIGHTARGDGFRGGMEHASRSEGFRGGMDHAARGDGFRGGMNHGAMGAGSRGGLGRAPAGGGHTAGMGHTTSMGHAGGGARVASAHAGGGTRRR